MLLALLDRSTFVAASIDAIAGEPVHETTIVQALVARARSLTRPDDRQPIMRAIVALQPADGSAQRLVADVVVWLIDQDTKADFRNALSVLPALGDRHGSKTRLSKAFTRAIGRGYKLTRPALEALHRAGVEIPKSKLTDPLRSFWKTLSRS